MEEPIPLHSPDAEDPRSPYEGNDLCLCCLSENPDDALLCSNCGAPIDPLAAYLPYCSILAEGYIYRQAATNCTNRFTLAGIWLMFAPASLCFLWMLASRASPAVFSVNAWPSTTVFGNLFTLGYIAGSIAMLVRTTRSYLRSRRTHIPGDIT